MNRIEDKNSIATYILTRRRRESNKTEIKNNNQASCKLQYIYSSQKKRAKREKIKNKTRRIKIAKKNKFFHFNSLITELTYL